MRFDFLGRTNTHALKQVRHEVKVLPLPCKLPNLSMARMAHKNGGPVSSRRRNNSVLKFYFRGKYIDTQIQCVFFSTLETGYNGTDLLTLFPLFFYIVPLRTEAS